MWLKEFSVFPTNGKANSIMSKYDYGLDLKNNNNSRKLVDDSITENSLILEFGPSSGELTKHLSENKHCIVDIVEIDSEAGTIAAKYSRNALLGNKLGDIENFIWKAKFKDFKYDFIIFSDVLEHLYNPKAVLEQCKHYLNNNGKIIISVPNIANNAIILNLLRDQFEYTNTGLLDNTHIHFFSLLSLEKMITEVGLVPIKRRATYVDVGHNEVEVSYDLFDDITSNVVKSHCLGEIYQFVYELAIQDKTTENSKSLEEFISQNNTTNITTSLYYDLGQDFEESCKVVSSMSIEHNGHFIAKFDFPNELLVKRLRFDPLEGENAILDLKSVKINGIESILVNKTTNCTVCFDHLEFFLHKDPQIIFETASIVKGKIEFEGFIYVRKQYIEMVTQRIPLINENLLKLQNDNAKLQNDNTRLQNDIHTIENSFEWKLTYPIRMLKRVFRE